MERGCPMKYKYTTQQLEEMERCKWLTDRERSVFDLVYRRGWAIEDTAAELYVSRSTVDADLRSIREKTSVKTAN